MTNPVASFIRGNKKEMCTLFAVLVILYLAPIDRVTGMRLKGQVVSPINKIMANQWVYLLMVGLLAYMYSLDSCSDCFICLALFLVVQKQ